MRSCGKNDERWIHHWPLVIWISQWSTSWWSNLALVDELMMAVKKKLLTVLSRFAQVCLSSMIQKNTVGFTYGHCSTKCQTWQAVYRYWFQWYDAYNANILDVFDHYKYDHDHYLNHPIPPATHLIAMVSTAGVTNPLLDLPAFPGVASPPKPSPHWQGCSSRRHQMVGVTMAGC